MEFSALSAGLMVGAVAATALVWWRERQGALLLGPRPNGPEPDTRPALGLALCMWFAFQLALPLLGWRGIPAVFAFTAANVIVALAVLRVALRRRPAAAGRARRALAAVVGGGVLLGLVQIVQVVVAFGYEAAGHDLPTQPVVQLLLEAELPGRVLMVVVSVLLAPFAEEVFFRGVLLPAAATWLGEARGLAAQALAFGLIHFVARPDLLPMTVPLMLAGWGFGWLRLRTGSLAVAFVAHAVFNGVQVAALLAG